MVGTRVPCYTDPVANLTISVDDDLLQRARVRAAEQGTSVNAVLREELSRYVDSSAGDRAAEALLEASRTLSGSSAPEGRTWTRDELWLERL